jgi:hypothetical protein
MTKTLGRRVRWIETWGGGVGSAFMTKSLGRLVRWIETPEFKVEKCYTGNYQESGGGVREEVQAWNCDCNCGFD